MQLNHHYEKKKGSYVKEQTHLGRMFVAVAVIPQGEWEEGEQRAHFIFISFWQK